MPSEARRSTTRRSRRKDVEEPRRSGPRPDRRTEAWAPPRSSTARSAPASCANNAVVSARSPTAPSLNSKLADNAIGSGKIANGAVNASARSRTGRSASPRSPNAASAPPRSSTAASTAATSPANSLTGSQVDESSLGASCPRRDLQVGGREFVYGRGRLRRAVTGSVIADPAGTRCRARETTAIADSTSTIVLANTGPTGKRRPGLPDTGHGQRGARRHGTEALADCGDTMFCFGLRARDPRPAPRPHARSSAATTRRNGPIRCEVLRTR